jgi:Flp pilus assembly protein TadG
LIVLLGIIDYGHIYFVELTMTNAAREGARVGVTQGDSTTAQSEAIAAATAYLDSAGISGTVQATAPTSASPTVRVSVTLDPFTPMIGFVSTPDRLSVSAAMRWELASP